MKKDAIIAQLTLRIKKLKKHFVKLQNGFDQEELHDFRLEMKKLKAFLRLLNTNRPHNKKLRLKQRLKTYYQLTGSVRNMQLHEQRIKELAKEHQLEAPVTYMSLLEQGKKETLEQLQQAEQSVSFEKLYKKKQGQGPSKLSARDSKSYLAYQCNSLMAILVPATYIDDALHEVRKIMKDISYNRDYLGSHMSLLLPAFLIKKEEADKLSEKLGDFHDYCVSLSFLQSPLTVQVNDQNEKNILQQLQSIIENEKENMKKEILQHLSGSNCYGKER